MISIHKTFRELLLEKDYEKITVKELCERAMINKKTFYTYYETLDFLLFEMQEQISSEYRERIKSYTLKDMEKLVREFFMFSEEQGEFYEKITCGGTYTKIREQMIMKVSSDRDIYPELSGFPQAEQNMIRTFLAESLLAMYRTWIMDGKKIPVQRAIEITSEALIHGVKNYMK